MPFDSEKIKMIEQLEGLLKTLRTKNVITQTELNNILKRR